MRGNSRSQFSRMTCAAFWTLAATMGISVWIEAVSGALNPADPPSRDCVNRTKPFNVPNKRSEVPNSLSRILLSYQSLKGSQFSTPSGPNGFTPAWICPCALAESQ